MFIIVTLLPPTLFPVLISCTSLRISVVPLAILVVMPKAWEKNVFSGSGLAQRLHMGQWHSARLAAGMLFSTSMSQMSERSSLVNTKPVFSPGYEAMVPPELGCFQVSSDGLACHGGVQPVSTTVFLQRDVQICCICLEPPASAATTKHWG